jgi:xanthine dehydrogenase large subunit
VIEQVIASSDYQKRRNDVLAFNSNSRTQVRGIAMTPVKFGISFTRRTLNQGNAHVNVYLDGTVQVSTGGTEMGQGLNTKIRQLVADQFGLPVAHVRVMPTSTEKNNNTSPTAASAGTDLNGTAAMRACAQVTRRLAQVAANKLSKGECGIAADDIRFAEEHAFASCNPTDRIPFRELVAAAYEERIDLGARGFYATPGVDLNRETGQGTPFYYFTNGASVAEVCIDRFTGDVVVERVDLLIDLGRMVNPAIDRGQVVGGFVQGMGWVTTEALIYKDDGHLLSDSATTYKIPSATDVPKDFRVAFLDNDNRINLFGSKAVGEPPLLMAISVWAAIKNAVAAATGCADLDLPATGEEVLKRLSAGDATSIPANVNGVAQKRPATAVT